MFSEVLKVTAPKRKWKRFKVDIRVRLRRWGEPEDAASVVRTYELSEGGISVYASETLEIGALILAEFALPSTTHAMRIRAIVRNRRGFRCGLEFLDLPATERLEIARYLGATEGASES